MLLSQKVITEPLTSESKLPVDRVCVPKWLDYNDTNKDGFTDDWRYDAQWWQLVFGVPTFL